MLKAHIDDLLGKSKKFEKKREWRNITANTTYIKDDINPDAQKFRKQSRAEECIIYYLLKRPEDHEKIAEKAPPEIFVTSFNKRLYSALIDRMKHCEKFTISMLADEFSAGEMGRISGIEAKNRDYDINSQVFSDCVKTLKEHTPPAPANGGDISNDDLLDIFKSKGKK